MTLSMVTKERPHTMSNQIEDAISQKKKKSVLTFLCHV